MNYYNENDPRSITDVSPNDLTGFAQCHFFAGIGGWPLALQLAGWPESRPVWTGSCPCQPFSVAGKRKGSDDERHLWPAFARLIAERTPPTVFGEQVASKDGRAWLDGVFVDLEGMAYAVAGADLCAAGVGAPHIRQRLFWVADANEPGPFSGPHARVYRGEESARSWNGQPERCCDVGGMEHTPSLGRVQWRPESGGRGVECGCELGPFRMEHANGAEEERFGFQRVPMEPEQETRRSDNADPWARFDLIGCADGKTRRIESGTFPLAHGVSGRVGLLRGYGNAIVPQVAATFIAAYLDTQAPTESEAA